MPSSSLQAAFNHDAAAPNCAYDAARAAYVVVRDDVAEGDELTVDYRELVAGYGDNEHTGLQKYVDPEAYFDAERREFSQLSLGGALHAPS